MSDIAKAVGVSVGTVDRALNSRGRIDAATRDRVLEAASAMGYRRNLSASMLASGKRFRISVNLPSTTRFFFDEVRVGIEQAHRTFADSLIELEYRFFPRLGVGEREAFDSAIDAGVDGIIAVFSERSREYSLRANPTIPVVAVVTGAPSELKIPSVSIDPEMSGSLAAGLLGQILRGRSGKLAIETGDLNAWEHRKKIKAFTSAIEKYHPALQVLTPVETLDLQEEAYGRTKALIDSHSDLLGYYVSTGNSEPTIRALKAAKLLGKVALITTDVFPEILPYIKSGAIAATLYQRPRVQGEFALRTLYSILSKVDEPAKDILLQPHVIMRENLRNFSPASGAEPA